MKDFFNQVFLSNPIHDYAILLGILLFVFVFKRFLSRSIASLLFKGIRYFSKSLNQQEFIDLLLRPLEYFILIVTFIISIDHFKFPAALNFVIYKKGTLQDLSDILLQIIFTISFIWIMLRLIDFTALLLEKKAKQTDDKTDDQLVVFFRDFLRALTIIIGIIFISRIILGKGVVDKLSAALGIAGAALALAARESIENLIASFVIFFDKPFKVGDLVKVDVITGNIEKIGLRSTRIRTLEKTFVTVPNKKMVDSILDNLTLRTQRRTELRIELHNGTSSEQLVSLLKDINEYLTDNKDVLEGHTVNLNDFTKDSLIIQLIYNTDIIDWNAFCNLREKVNLVIVQLIEKHGIKLARSYDTTTAQ